jgi:putative endonuclease
LMNGSYYIGSCNNLEYRYQQHNKGLVKSTKRYLPWNLVHSEEYLTLHEARQREKQIKAWKKRSAIKSLIERLKIK